MTSFLKKSLITLGIFFGVGIILFLIIFIGFKKPNNHNSARYGTVHIQMIEDSGIGGWSHHHIEVASSILSELNRLGPQFILGGSGDRFVEILSVDLTDGQSGQCTEENGVGRFIRNSLSNESHIEIDPTCTRGDDEFRTVLMHEIGHFLGMEHICRIDDAISTHCSNVGRGLAVMNPNLSVDRREDVIGSFNGVTNFGQGIPVFQIQELDIKEFLRTNL